MSVWAAWGVAQGRGVSQVQSVGARLEERVGSGKGAYRGACSRCMAGAKDACARLTGETKPGGVSGQPTRLQAQA